MEKTNHSQFTAFVLSEVEDVNRRSKPSISSYFIWIGGLIVPIIGLIIGVFNGGELDKNVSNILYSVYNVAPFLRSLGIFLQYAYLVVLGIAVICLGIVIGFLASKTKKKLESIARYATLYLLVISFSFIIHVLTQLLINRPPPAGDYSSIQPFYQVGTSIAGFWSSSFPNRNITLSGIVVLLPVLFGKRSAVFKGIMGVVSGIIILAIGITEIGLSHAWFTDVCISLEIVLLVAWLLYWHVLFIKDREYVNFYHKLTSLYYTAYAKIVESKEALNSGNLEASKTLLNMARELYNQSISSIRDLPGNVKSYLNRSEYWKFNVALLLKELETTGSPSRKWTYIF